MIKNLSNQEIYILGNNFLNFFKNNNKYFSAKIAFMIQKNKKNISELLGEIENSRNEILKQYSDNSEDGKIQIPKENIEKANQEIEDLLNIRQDIEIYTLSFKDIENIEFTMEQMESLLFMIEDPEDDDDDEYIEAL